VLAPIHIIIVVGLFLMIKLLLKYLKKFFNERDYSDKSITTFDGKEVPVWRLVKQFIWLVTILIGFKGISIENPDLDLSRVLAFEFFRFEKFHLAIYHFFVFIVVYTIGRIVLNILRIYLQRRFKKRNGIDEGSEFVYLQLSKYVLITVSVIIIMRSLGIDLDLFITATAFLLVGLGLGLQDIFKDFFAGLLLLFEGSIKVGDVIEIDRFDGKDNFVAKIEQINIRTSKVKTREGKKLIVPNSNLTFQKVHNWDSDDEYTRFTIPVSVMYGVDLELVSKILKEAAYQHPMVSKDHEIIVRLVNFGDFGLELDVIFWSKRSLYIEIHKSDIRFEIDRKFREHHIEYPYPQLDVHYNQKTTTKPNDTGKI
jgi:small-conductance mechanosensitive channel